MEARTGGNSNRCFRYPLRLSTKLPASSFLPDTNVPVSNDGAGRLHSHCFSMEEPAMVSSTPVHAYRASSAIASGSENPEAPRDRQDSSPLLPDEFQEKLAKQRLFVKSVKKFIILLGKQNSQAI